jgi:hypothetical protein
MTIIKSSTPMRVFFLFASSFLWLGIWLTGFSLVHWVLYLPTAAFLFAALTGICPSLIASNYLFAKGEHTCTR